MRSLDYVPEWQRTFLFEATLEAPLWECALSLDLDELAINHHERLALAAMAVAWLLSEGYAELMFCEWCGAILRKVEAQLARHMLEDRRYWRPRQVDGGFLAVHATALGQIAYAVGQQSGRARRRNEI